jgi:hypothetical protein
MLNFRKRKDIAVKKWRSRAWSINPRVTKLSIIKTEAPKVENIDTADLALISSSQLQENCAQFFEAIADMEQINQQ